LRPAFAIPPAGALNPDCRNPFMRIQNTLKAFAFASLMPLAALAQAPQQVQPPPKVQAPPPPQTMPLEEGEPPAVTIPGGGQRKEEIIKHRKQGRVTEIEVHTPSSSYTVRPNEQPGSALPGDAESTRNRAAQFTIKRFPVPKPKNEEEAEAAQPGAPAAPAASGAPAAPIAK
jgi:hypothetical protein